MGNQPSKPKNADGNGPGLESLPSFSRSETKESSRSLRLAIRNKIPGAGKADSPRSSSAGLGSNNGSSNGQGDRSDAASIKSSMSAKSNGAKSHRGSTSSNRPSMDQSQLEEFTSTESPPTDLPPPSPTTSHTIGKSHDHVDAAQRRGEVGNVSDAPPTGMYPLPGAQPKESILVKNDHPIPRSTENATVGEGSSIETTTLKAADLDDMISRLLDAAYAGKVTK